MGTTAPPICSPGLEPGPHGTRRSPLVALVLLMVVALVAVTVVIVVAVRRDNSSSTSGTAPIPSASASAPLTSAAPTPSPSASSSQPSALTALAPFLAAATRLDAQLATAAAAINASGPTWTQVDVGTAQRVQAADLRPVAAAIPAGLPPQLLERVLLVYSDLASRRYAMQSFANAYVLQPGVYPSATELVKELRNGHAAALRFDADLASARALAAVTAPVAAVPETSRTYAEKLLLVDYVNRANGGCDSRGGVVVTTPPVITWHSAGPMAGTIGGIDFVATLKNGHWTAYVNAC